MEKNGASRRDFTKVRLMSVVLLGCVGCDQVTKSIARHGLETSGPISFLHDTFRLEYAENSGTFLSLGANIADRAHYPIVAILVGLILTGTLIYILRAKELTTSRTIALSLLLAGGLGNLIDRLHNDGRVIDFLNLGIGSLRSGIFNVADMAISAGFVWLLVLSARSREKEPLRPPMT